MAKQSISASALVPASPQKIYALIADYRHGHPRILPKPYFISLDVEKGGYGEGTIINFQMKVMGQIMSFHSVISEPVPAHTLVETDLITGAATTFTVEPRSEGSQSFVTISTTMNVPEGISGKVQGWLTARYLHPIYVNELEQLAQVAKEY
jgi:hypothetical protein